MRAYNLLSDEQVFALLKSQEEAAGAFEELYNRYWARLYASACKRLETSEVAEEIVQDFFTSLWLNRAKIELEISFQAYSTASIRYRVFSHFQKESVRAVYKDSVLSAEAEYDDSTQETLYLKEFYRQLEKQLLFLPAKCRSVFEMSRKLNKSNKEIARELGISEKTVENQLTKALKRLRVNLSHLFLYLVFVLLG